MPPPSSSGLGLLDHDRKFLSTVKMLDVDDAGLMVLDRLDPRVVCHHTRPDLNADLASKAGRATNTKKLVHPCYPGTITTIQ